MYSIGVHLPCFLPVTVSHYPLLFVLLLRDKGLQPALDIVATLVKSIVCPHKSGIPMSAAWQRCTQSSSASYIPSGERRGAAETFPSRQCTSLASPAEVDWPSVVQKRQRSPSVATMVLRWILVFVAALVSVSVTGTPPQLPDTSGIDFVLTDRLNVDQFFSLWLVFNNDDVKMSGRTMFRTSFPHFLSDDCWFSWCIVSRVLNCQVF
jgi:hypothetical protein